MKRARYLIAGLLLIGLVNAVVLLGAAWNREEPADSSLQLSERELGNTHAYWRKDNSSLTLRLDYRWPSRDSENTYLSISVEKMAELGFALPGELNDEGVRRFQQIFRQRGIEDALKEKGIQEGDTVRIGDMEFEFRL